MAVNAIEMRRSIFGVGNLVETLLGRMVVCVLFTSLVGAVLLLTFLVNRLWSPIVLKYAILFGLGFSSAFAAHRLLPGRNILIKLFSTILSLLVALTLMDIPTRGFIGLNFLRGYPNNPPWDGALQLALTSAIALLALRVRIRHSRRVPIEPRSVTPRMPSPTPPRRPIRRPSRSRPSAPVQNVTLRVPSTGNGLSRRLNGSIPAPAPRVRRRRKSAKKATPKRNRRGWFSRPSVSFSSAEQHVCPYCLERVIRNDPRGVKICKVCKTWHHGDCWDITGVCQVPHEYVS